MQTEILAWGLALSAELSRLAALFRQAEIPVIPVRGPLLAQLLYGVPAARPIADLDLLVKKADLRGAMDLLSGAGYESSERRLDFVEAYGSEVSFRRRSPFPVTAELHWSIAYPPFMDRVDMSRVWERSVEGRSLSDEDLLIHLCLHWAHKQPRVPFFLTRELGLFLEKYRESLDWPYILSVAREAGIGPLLCRGLGEARERCGAHLPEGIRARLARLGPRSWMDRAAYRVATRSGSRGRERMAVFFALRGIRGRFRFVLALLFPGPAYMESRYGAKGKWQIAWAYPRRLFDLLAQAFGAPGKPPPLSGRLSP